MKTSITIRSREARKLVKEYEKADQASNQIYWYKAKAIYFLKKDNLWKFAVGESAGSWGAFCAEILKCPTVTADHRAQNYEFYIIRHKFTLDEVLPYDAYSLYYITIHAKDKPKNDLKELMKSSVVLARHDLLEYLKGSDCEHEHTHEESDTVVICDDCKKKLFKRKKGP